VGLMTDGPLSLAVPCTHQLHRLLRIIRPPVAQPTHTVGAASLLATHPMDGGGVVC
jgi:hypothetical protein